MATVEGQKTGANSSTFKAGIGQRVLAVGSDQRYPVLSPYKTAIKLPVLAIGSTQRYPPLSLNKTGLKTPIISLATKLVVSEAATSIRKVTKLFGQLFP